MRLWLLPLIGFLTFPLCATAQQTETARGAYLQNPLALEVQLAPVGSPTGVLGVVADYAALPELSLTGGMGLGTTNSLLQVALGVRPRIPISPRFALDMTIGYSHGDFDRIVNLDIAQGIKYDKYRNCSWINGDIGLETRFESNIVIVATLGLSRLVASDAPHWSLDRKPGTEQQRWPTLTYIGLAIGYAWDLSDKVASKPNAPSDDS